MFVNRFMIFSLTWRSVIDIITLEVRYMNDRIRELSQKEFAGKIGLKQNAISYMEKSGSTVTEQNIKAICSQFSVDEHWLRTGCGKMFIENEKKRKEFFAIFDGLSPALQDYLIRTAKDLLDTQAQIQTDEKDQGHLLSH